MKKKINSQVWLSCLIILAFCLAGCHPGLKEDVTAFTSLKKLHYRQYPQFEDDLDFHGFINSIDQSLVYFNRVPFDRKYHYGKEIFTATHMISSLETFKRFLLSNPSVEKLNQFIQSRFLVYESVGNEEDQVLFTGYFEPIYFGSLEKTDVYSHPVYARPEDLVSIDLSAFSEEYKGHKRLMARVDKTSKKVVPYYSREQINSIEDFHTRSVPVVWLKSRIDRFFLEVQGSGRVILNSGEQLRIHYVANNGSAYSSIGRYLIDKGEIPKEEMSMQAIRKWLEQNPERMDEVLHYNESFVFFQEEQGGPFGSLGVEVTSFRSIATDRKLFPKGGLCFLQTQLPDRINIYPLKKWEKTSFFVMNQDTGGAIKGPARADIFCGNGSYAEFTAGHMNTRGRMFFLVLKDNQG